MNVRVATESDIPALHRIRRAVGENRLADERKVQPADYVRLLTTDGRGWVAEVDGRIAGFAVADLTSASVWALFVDPAHEQQGIGRALHETMIAWLFASGVDRAHLTTEPGTRAERFYRAAGWTFVGMQDGEAQFELINTTR